MERETGPSINGDSNKSIEALTTRLNEIESNLMDLAATDDEDRQVNNWQDASRVDQLKEYLEQKVEDFEDQLADAADADDLDSFLNFWRSSDWGRLMQERVRISRRLVEATETYTTAA